MSQLVKLKRTAVEGKVPSTNNLELGELAINTYDGRIFFEKDNGTPSIQQVVTTNAQTTGSLNIIGGVTASFFVGNGSQLTNLPAVDVSQVATVTSSFDNQSSVSVLHNFNTKNVIISVYQNNDTQIIPQSVTLTNNNTADIVLSGNHSGYVVVAKGGHIVSGSATDSLLLNGQAGSYYLDYTNFTNIPSGIISSSAQIDTLFNIDGLISGATQITPLLPAGTVSGSSQLTSSLDTRYLTIVGDGVISGSLKLSEIEIETSGNNPIIDTVDDINGWIYTNKSFSVGAQETAPNGIYFSTDGTNMYIIGSSGDDINQYSLSTAWNISTASFVRLFSVSAQDTAPTSLFFSPDGLILYVLGDTNNRVFRYSLSTAWDISTTIYTNNSFVVTESTPNGLWFKSDGSIMYVVGTTSDTIVRYNLSTNWDITTATLINSFSLSTQDSSPVGVFFTNDGLTFYVVGQTNDNINRYDLSVAFDITTAYYVGRLFLGNQELTPSDLYIAFDENKAFLIGSSSDAIFEYSINNSLLRVTSDALLINANNTTISGSVSIDRNVDIAGNARVFGTVTAGTFSGAGSFTTLTSTSTTTLASSTATQTVSLGTGATVTNATKTINIGTAGVSGSTTIVNIGSSVVNSRTTGSLFGHWQISGSLNVQDGITGSIAATNGVISGSSQITDLTTFNQDVSGNSTYAVSHSLNEEYPLVQAWNTSSKRQEVPSIVESTSVNSLTITFSSTFNGRIVVKK